MGLLEHYPPAGHTVPPSLENLTGQGTWFWTNQPEQPTRPLQIYAVGNSSLPTATYNLDIDSSVVPSGTTIGVLEFGTGLVNSDRPLRNDTHRDCLQCSCWVSIRLWRGVRVQWMAGNSLGVLLDGSGLPGAIRYFGYGAVSSIAGSSARVTLAYGFRRNPFLQRRNERIRAADQFHELRDRAFVRRNRTGSGSNCELCPV